MRTEQPTTGFGKRRSAVEDKTVEVMRESADREEAREALGSLARIGQEIDAEIMKLSVAAMNGISIDRARRDDLLVLSKKYDQLVQAVYAGDEMAVRQIVPGFSSLLQRVTNIK